MDAKSLRTALVDSSERRKFSTSLLNSFPNILKAIGLEPVAPQLVNDSRNKVVQGTEIQELWEQGRFCDVELNIRGETFKAHRIILAAASGYWKKVFTGDIESRKLDIEQNCSKDTVLGVLRYMYTTKLPDDVAGTSGRFVEFLRLAREWEVVELRERLEEMLLRAKGRAIVAGKVDKRFNTVS
ncbi:BTB/POZ protein [Trichophaea hybrida]|nr:BTB/POZ protein [Trichophaea hybrida]